MAQYRFHISDREIAFFDEDGLDLPTPSAALEEAAATAWELMYELADEISDWSDWRVDVVDESDSVVLVLPFEHLLRTAVAQPADIGLMRTMPSSVKGNGSAPNANLETRGSCTQAPVAQQEAQRARVHLRLNP
jgi:hypothetical protein